MMDLHTQVITIFFSFLYGIFLEITLHISTKVIYHSSYFIKYIGTFMFVIFHVLLYFLILQMINYGIIHIYLIICLILGYAFSYNIKKHLTTRVTFFHKK